MTSSSSEQLTQFDAIRMAVGEMGEGGIFSVLGVAAKQSGNSAFLSSGMADVLALIIGVVGMLGGGFRRAVQLLPA